MTLVWGSVNTLLAELADMQTQVCSFVLVDNVSLCQLVQHFLNRRIELYCLFLVRHCAQLANCITHSLCVVSVVQSLNLVLTDSLK